MGEQVGAWWQAASLTQEKALLLIPALQKQKKQKLGVVAHTFECCSQEAEVGKLLNLRLSWTTQLDPGELVL